MTRVLALRPQVRLLAGTQPLVEAARVSELVAVLSQQQAPWRKPTAGHDPGKVALDLVTRLAGGLPGPRGAAACPAGAARADLLNDHDQAVGRQPRRPRAKNLTTRAQTGFGRGHAFAERKRLRVLFAIAARLIRTARCVILDLDKNRPHASTVAEAVGRLRALPAPG